MKIHKCSDISTFKKRVVKLVSASNSEWQGRQITFGYDKISRRNLFQFLKNNRHFWIRSANPALAESVRELSKRIALEYPSCPLADLLAEKAPEMKLPSNLQTMILGRLPRNNFGYSISFFDLMCFLKDIKQWNHTSFRAIVEWVNYNKAPIDYIYGTFLKFTNRCDFAVQCGNRLEYLKLKKDRPISSTDFVKIMQACPNLKSISLAGFEQTLEFIIENYTKLETLSMSLLSEIKKIRRLPETILHLNLNLCNRAVIIEELPNGLRELELKKFSDSLIPRLPSKLEILCLKDFITSISELHLPDTLRKLKLCNCVTTPKITESLTKLILDKVILKNCLFYPITLCILSCSTTQENFPKICHLVYVL